MYRSRALPTALALTMLAGCFVSRSGTMVRDGGAETTDAEVLDDAATPDACVPGAEVCNGLDDDCDPTNADGSGDPLLGAACDDPGDPDDCAGGMLECAGGSLTCVGDSPDGRAELCDGVDNDCDPTTTDGSADPMIGSACDGLDDVDLCMGGTWRCDVAAGALACTGDDGDLPEEVEVCDGVDNDCDPSTADGSGDPMLGAACDAASDVDLCAEGSLSCTVGALACGGDDGNQPDEIEVCDGVDNDCDPSTPDGASDGRTGPPCDGADADVCVEGVRICSGGGIVCSDTTGSTAEGSCNGLDEDCDGTVDETITGCPCRQLIRAGHSYLFCSGGREWTEARDDCRATGYQLVTINDAAEQAWLTTSVGSAGRWWIGLNDRSTEGSYRWSSGLSSSYRNWNSGEPNNSGFFAGEDCTELIGGDTSGSGAAGGWNDQGCSSDRDFICEAGP